MSDPKPCPFCGGEAYADHVDLDKNDVGTGLSMLNCIEGCLDNTGSDRHTATIRADKWNHRPIEAALEARVAELEKNAARYLFLRVMSWPDSGYYTKLLPNDMDAAIDVAIDAARKETP